MSNGRRGARKSSAACNRPMIIATGALIARDALHPLLGECPVPLTRNPHPQPSPATLTRLDTSELYRTRAIVSEIRI
jgi:hypothetical protein